MRRRTPRRSPARSSKPAVERVEGRVLLASFAVTNTTDTAAMGSLRYAIGQSNATPGANTITFDIATMGGQAIDVLSALPTITVPVTIDGTTEPGYAGKPIVDLVGTGAGATTDGLDVSAGDTTIRGLEIDQFGGNGISLSIAGGDTVAADDIGTDPTGEVAAGNKQAGVLVQAGSNNDTISGNVISSNGAFGIYLNGNPTNGTTATSTTGDLVEGNLIGTDSLGEAALPNLRAGVDLLNAPMTTIGGTTAAARNIISGNSSNNLSLQANSDGSVVEGNYIGTDARGQVPLLPANNNGGEIGVDFTGISNSTIGGTAAGAGNVISGNNDGINCFVIGSMDLAIQGNLIGTDPTGTKAVPNARYGVDIAGPANVTLGGTTPAARNVISGNGSNGIETFGFGQGFQIEGNFIGTDITGTQPLGNLGIGVDITYPGVTIGGLAAGAGNIIANNGHGGPPFNSKSSNVFARSHGTSILSNSIYNAGNLGIEIPRGTNGNIAPPALTSAFTAPGGSTIAGTLTDPAGVYTVQFFATPGPDSSGNAEGETLLGTATVVVASGSVGFTENLATPYTPGELITATATDAAGDTSEFSAGIAGQETPLPPTITVSESATTVPAGQQVTDTFTITNPATLATDTGLIFTDVIPLPRVNYISGSTSATVPLLFTGGTASADIGDLGPGQSVTVTIVLQPTIAAEPMFSNTGQVTSVTPPITAGQVTATVTAEVTPSADLAVAITAPSGPALIGQPLVYTVTAANLGPSPAADVQLTDILPGASAFVSAESSSGQVIPPPSDGSVVDTIPTLAAGAMEVLTIVVVPNATAVPSISDSAMVTDGEEFDPDEANNATTITTLVNPVADLALTGDAVTPASVTVGGIFTFVLTVANRGPSMATDVTVTDTLPPGLVLVSGNAAAGTVSETGGVVSAPVGLLLPDATSTITFTAFATAAGTFSDSATVGSSVPDPDPFNNTAKASFAVTPVADVAVALAGPSGTFYAGTPLTYTAVVTNNGPSPATGVAVDLPLFPGAMVVVIGSGGVAGTVAGGVASQAIGTLAPGASTTVTLVVVPTEPGTVAETATVTSTSLDTNLTNNAAASPSATLVTPVSSITFASEAYEATENAGYALITFDRSAYFSDTVTIHFSTTFGGNATPGVDYEPVSQEVVFPPGATTATAIVPVLENPDDNHNEIVALEIDSPTGSGALVPGATTTTLTVVDIDPVLVGPTIVGLQLSGPVDGITSIQVDTTGNLDTASADNPLNYTITALGGKYGLPFGTVVPVASATYTFLNGAVTLIPSQPLPVNELFLVTINGSRPGAITDTAGNPLNSVLGAVPGSDYNLTVARGTTISYTNENDDPANLSLTGPGTLDVDRFVDGQVMTIQVLGGVPHQTVVSGTVKPSNVRTTVQSILGLGPFGLIRVKLTTPPFYVDNMPYPNLETQVDAPAYDVLLPSPPAPAKPAKGKAKAKAKPAQVKTAAVEAASPHARGAAHAPKVQVAVAHPAPARRR